MSSTWDGMKFERSLIPPDEPVNMDVPVETERGEILIRETFKDGSCGWRIIDHELTEYEQDRYEEAYELGLLAVQAQSRLAREMAYGRGVFDTAVAAYAGKRR